MSNGSDIAEEIAEALAEAGAAVGDGPLYGYVIRAGTVDRTSHEPVIGEPTETEVVCVLSNFTDQDRAAGAVAVGDVKVLMEAGKIEPTPADKFRISGKVYGIVNVNPIQQGGVPLMYIVQARRS